MLREKWCYGEHFYRRIHRKNSSAAMLKSPAKAECKQQRSKTWWVGNNKREWGRGWLGNGACYTHQQAIARDDAAVVAALYVVDSSHQSHYSNPYNRLIFTISVICNFAVLFSFQAQNVKALSFFRETKHVLFNICVALTVKSSIKVRAKLKR